MNSMGVDQVLTRALASRTLAVCHDKVQYAQIVLSEGETTIDRELTEARTVLTRRGKRLSGERSREKELQEACDIPNP